MGMGWHMGISRGVSFTARVAATLAVARTLPFTTVPSRMAESVSWRRRILPDARASRYISPFPPMSTIRALSSPICVNSVMWVHSS
ncbi:MAG: hypothetical protein A4E40_01514 [Methanoregulaceae archaeon PtaU1.Bin059]|nr:MAG: hypothetical protein A4E40_01514 [Methanoregulaceae archaeon PtaU1.Bin059]